MAKWTKKLHFSKGSWVPVLIVASCTFVALWNPVPLQILRNALFDQFQRWQPRIYQQAPVRIIDIDDESLRRLGQWPWPRTRIAELISRLQAAHPSSIALDVLFTEPDRTSPQAMLKLWQLAPTVHDQLLALPDHDEVLAKVISQGKVVLGFALERQGHAGVAPEVKARYILSGEPPQPYLHAFSGSLKPLATLESAASGLGAIAFLPDADGVVRRVPLVLRIGETLVPSLSAEALRVALGVKNYQIKTVAGGGVGLAEMRIGTVKTPTTPQGEVWLHYTRPVPSRTLPAWKVLAGEVPATDLANNILLVGTSAQGLMDLRFSPLGSALPGVEVHAQALEQLLAGGGLELPPWAQTGQVLIGIAGGLAVGVVALSSGAVFSLAVLAALLTTLWAATWYLFSQQAVLVDAVAPSLTLTLSYMLSSIVHHFVSEKRQRWIKRAFSRYVSPNLVAYLIKQPDALELGGKRQECSFVFTDLVGFTSWLEGMDPAAAVSLLNDYLDGMIAIVFAHQGTLDRIVGDAVVVMFSAPVLQADHRLKALSCALEMHRFSNRYVSTLANRGIRFGLTRIGIHTGEVIVGNFGGNAMFDYRALGDPINTAARLESANKQLGTLICVSQATLSGCPGWPARPIGQVLLKGKSQSLQIFEPQEPQAESDQAYLAAFALLKEQQPGALQAFTSLAEQRPKDTLVAAQLARLRRGQVGDLIVLTEK